MREMAYWSMTKENNGLRLRRKGQVLIGKGACHGLKAMEPAGTFCQPDTIERIRTGWTVRIKVERLLLAAEVLI